MSESPGEITPDAAAASAHSHVRALRQAYWANGYRPVAIWSPGAEDEKGKPRNGAGKAPAGRDWRKRALTDPPHAVTASVSSQALNTGIVLDKNCIAIDVDVPVEGLAGYIVGIAERVLGRTQLWRIGNAPKTLLVYRPETPLTKLCTPELYLPGEIKVQVEVLAQGQQFVADGIHPDTGRPYWWLADSPAEVPVANLPIITEAGARVFLAEAEALLRAAGGVEKEPPEPKSRQGSQGAGERRTAIKGDDFFRNVNSAALADIAAWAPTLLPRGRFDRHGAYRITSEALGRDYEEDLSIHPDGIKDFGPAPTEKGKPLTAIKVVIEYGDADGPLAAANWLCGKLGKTPESLGWKARHNGTAADDETDGGVDHPTLIEVEGRTFKRVDDSLWRSSDGYEMRPRPFADGGADRLFEFRAPDGAHWCPDLTAAELGAPADHGLYGKPPVLRDDDTGFTYGGRTWSRRLPGQGLWYDQKGFAYDARTGRFVAPHGGLKAPERKSLTD
jgi:hypothetical protein